MNRLQYLIHRLLLLGVSFMGILLVSFLFTQIVPGGPVEQRIAEMRGDGKGGMASEVLSEEQIEAIYRTYHLDKPPLVQFKIWLVDDFFGMQRKSYKFTHKTSWEMIKERFPVSLSFGIPSLILTYVICVPLGIAKALKNGKAFDLISSIVVFTLYALPAFAFGMLLKLAFAGITDQSFDWFPLGGFRSQGFENLSFWEQVKDQVWHMTLPVTCYIIGNFAVTTLLMKNSLLEQISQDYVRTVLAKGATVKQAVWRHAFRNSLIPIATGIGGILTVMFAGSVLIEQVFNIPGIGQMSLEALRGRDYPVFLGIVCLQSILGLVGQLLTDFCYMFIDPRMDFGGQK